MTAKREASKQTIAENIKAAKISVAKRPRWMRDISYFAQAELKREQSK